MCGICGVWNSSGVAMPVLRAMAAAIRHRGPDHEGFYVNAEVGLANRRLSIIDLDGGNQPIFNEDESIVVVFNGEIYNYAALRDELLARGHRFQTESDTEVLVHLYEEEGVDCVRRLTGMFAFALWDSRRRRLFLARDHLGQKPLYYATVDGAFVFGSEAKALLQYPGMQRSLDVEGMHDLLSLRCIPGDRTLLGGIRKLPAGCRMTVEQGRVQQQSYWDLRYLPKQTAPPPQITRDLGDLLQETVAGHMVSDVPLGAFLSGGIDSSLIVALMARASKQPIKTFSIGVREQSFNELPYARRLAEHCGTEHHEGIVEPDLIALLPEMISFMEEPIDPFAFGVYSVAKLAAPHVKVVLGGDGGDEMFAGYDRYVGQRLVDHYCRVPAVLRRRFLEPLFDRLPDSYAYNNRVQKLRWLARMSQTTGGRRYADSACFLRFTHERKQTIYQEALWRRLDDADSADRLVELFDSADAEDVVDRMLYTDVKTRLPEHLLMVGDRMTMAHSIEVRSPIVDRDVAEFAATVPAGLKVHGRRLKHIQREVCRGLVPDELIRRKKQGFSFPLAHWFRGEVGDLAADLLATGSLAGEGYFRPDAMLAMLEEHAAGKCDHNYRLWLLLNLELWHRLFVEGESTTALQELLRKKLQTGSQSSPALCQAGRPIENVVSS